MQYLVTWEIDIEANSFEEAAKQAFEIQRDPDSQATAFTVIRQKDKSIKFIDLNEEKQNTEDGKI